MRARRGRLPAGTRLLPQPRPLRSRHQPAPRPLLPPAWQQPTTTRFPQPCNYQVPTGASSRAPPGCCFPSGWRTDPSSLSSSDTACTGCPVLKGPRVHSGMLMRLRGGRCQVSLLDGEWYLTTWESPLPLTRTRSPLLSGYSKATASLSLPGPKPPSRGPGSASLRKY